MKPSLPLLTALLLAARHATGAEAVTTAPQWQEVELAFTATRGAAHPYTDIEVWADFTHDDGTKIGPGGEPRVVVFTGEVRGA